MTVFEGGEYSEIKDMLRSNKSSRSQSVAGNVTINPCEFSTEIRELTQNMSAAKAEILTLKQRMVGIETTRSSELQTVKATVLSLKSDLNVLSNTVQNAVVDIKLAIERLESDRSLGVVSLKSELRVVKQTVKDLQDSMDSLGSLSSPGSHSTASKKPGNSSGKAKAKASTPGTGVWGVPAGASTSTESANAPSSKTVSTDGNDAHDVDIANDASQIGSHTEIQRNMNINNDQNSFSLQNNELDLDETAPQPDLARASLTVSPSFITSDLLTAEPLGVNSITSALSASSRPQSELYSHITANEGSRPNDTSAGNTPFAIVNTHIMQHGREAALHISSAAQSDSTRSTSQAQSTVTLNDCTSSITNVGNIPVHCTGNGQRSSTFGMTEDLESFVDNDADFLQYVKKKSKRFYLGGFKPEVTHDIIRTYVKRRGPTVTWLRIWPSKRNPNNVIIRLNVEDNEYADRLTSTHFWPRGVRCRPWVDKRRDNSDRRDTNPPNPSRQLYGRSEIDDYNPFSPLRDPANIDRYS